MGARWKRSIPGLVRHRVTKGRAEQINPRPNRPATSRLYPNGLALGLYWKPKDEPLRQEWVRAGLTGGALDAFGGRCRKLLPELPPLLLWSRSEYAPEGGRRCCRDAATSPHGGRLVHEATVVVCIRPVAVVPDVKTRSNAFPILPMTTIVRHCPILLPWGGLLRSIGTRLLASECGQSIPSAFRAAGLMIV